MAKRKVVSEFDKWFFSQFPQYKKFRAMSFSALCDKLGKIRLEYEKTEETVAQYEQYLIASRAAHYAWQAGRGHERQE